MNSNASIDALELMLTDLRTRNEPIRHKAAFRGCQPEFQALVSRLIEQLETELIEAKQRDRLDKRGCRPWVNPTAVPRRDLQQPAGMKLERAPERPTTKAGQQWLLQP